MAGSTNNIDTGALYFGTVNPTLTGQEVDNDSFIVTSDGTPTGTIISFWKFDEETLTWVIVPSGDLNNDRVLYTGNTTIPTLAPPKGVDTAVLSNGTRYDWDGTAWIPDFQQTWAEQRICLNTATPAFTPADVNNPLVSEVDAWAIANLTIQQRENGTILTYFDPSPKYIIQPTVTLNNPNSGVAVFDYKITSFIVNGTELVSTPIFTYNANTYVYTGQLGTLLRNYFTANNIIGNVDDGSFSSYNDLVIYGIQGATLTFSLTTDYSLDVTPTTFITTTKTATTTATLVSQYYNCSNPLFTFVLNKDNTITKLTQPYSPFYKENTTTDAGEDKYSKIYRYGHIGIGMNKPKAPLHILGVGDNYEPYLSDASIYLGGNGRRIYWGDNLIGTTNVHNVSIGEWNGDSDALSYHGKSGHRFYVKATAWDDNSSSQYPTFFIRGSIDYNHNVGKIGLNTDNPRLCVDFGNKTNPDGIIVNKDGMVLPGGTTAERPTTLIAGTIRFNSDTAKFEGYTGTVWVDLH